MTHKTALEKQIWESVAIDRLSSHSPSSYLNLKSEWGQSRMPALIIKDSGKDRKEPEKKGRRQRDKEVDSEMQEEGKDEETQPRKRRE